MSRPLVRKSDIGAPPARMSAGAPPVLPVSASRKAFRGSFKNATPRTTPTPVKKRRVEENLEEESDSDPSTAADDQEETGSVSEGMKKEEAPEGKSARKVRKKRRFRLTDSTVKSKRRAERRAQLAAERKEREELGLEVEEDKKEKSSSPSPPLASKPPMIRTYSPIQLLCDHLLRKLRAKDPEEYFAFPVTETMAPDYHERIGEPMDFSTMRDKIEGNKYVDLAEFKHDVNLVWKNALEYNQPHTIYHVAAQKLEQIANYYFSEPHLRYLFHSLPFCTAIPLEKMGLTPKIRKRPYPKVDRKAALVDDATPSSILNTVDVSLRNRLSARRPDLKKLLPDTESGVEPKCQLAFLDNKDGAVCLNVVNPINSDERTVVTLGELVGKLDEGNPGLFAPQESKAAAPMPISFLSYDPFSSFAPQFDSTWANLCERDSRLLLSTYGNKENATNAISMRQMAANAGDDMIKVVDDILDSLTDGEHRRTVVALEASKDAKAPEIVNTDVMKEMLSDLETLENVGIDVSFISDIRKLYGISTGTMSVEDQLNKTGMMVNDLAHLQKNRLSSVPPTTLSDQHPPNGIEINLAGKLQDQIHQNIVHYAKPEDVVSAAAIHNAVGLNEGVDLDLFNEFFTPATTSA